MAQVTFDEENQVFETVEPSAGSSDPIADGVDEYLEQIENQMPDESEDLTDAALPEETGEVPVLDDIPLDAVPGEEGIETEVPDSVEAPEMDPEYPFPYYFDSAVGPGVDLYSSVPSNAAFTPTAWQVNLASARQLGEHYLMYAVRQSYGSSYYWHYYLVLGSDISYADDIYTFADCDVYSYYNYSSTVFYELSVESGTVDGGVSLVYSDLYFDYVGTDPVVNAYPFISFIMFILIFVVILIGGRKNV